jgi:hypothetical protein
MRGDKNWWLPFPGIEACKEQYFTEKQKMLIKKVLSQVQRSRVAILFLKCTKTGEKRIATK